MEQVFYRLMPRMRLPFQWIGIILGAAGIGQRPRVVVLVVTCGRCEHVMWSTILDQVGRIQSFLKAAYQVHCRDMEHFYKK